MSIAIITGSSGLIGSESVAFFADKFDKVIGIDNDMRQYFFGLNASTDWSRIRLEEQFDNFTHIHADIRNQQEIEYIFEKNEQNFVIFRETLREQRRASGKEDLGAGPRLRAFNAKGVIISTQ